MTLKVSAAIIALIAFVLGLAVLLNYAKFERAFGGLAESRLGFLVQDSRGTLEFGLDLGLDPTAMANTAAILGREAAKDSRILSIIVFDHAGRALYQHQSDPRNRRSPLCRPPGSRGYSAIRPPQSGGPTTRKPCWSALP